MGLITVNRPANFSRNYNYKEFPFKIPPRVDRTPPPEMAELDVKPPTPLGFGKLLAPNAMGLRERKIQEETEGGVGAEFARIGGKDDLPMISSGTPIKDIWRISSKGIR